MAPTVTLSGWIVNAVQASVPVAAPLTATSEGVAQFEMRSLLVGVIAAPEVR